jgi:excisionase family DNA binding protein
MKLLNAKEVSEMLGVKPSTIYLWAEQRRIPCYKLNSLLRFSEEELRAWMKECKKQPEEGYNTPAGGRPRKGG